MQPAQKFLLGGWHRGVAVVLLLVLVFAPSCSSVCQARSCPISQSANSDSDCHHRQGVNPEDSQRLMASGGSCGSHELPAALPEGKGSCKARIPAGTNYSPVFFKFVATRAGVLSDSFSSDAGAVGSSRGTPEGPFSLNAFASLRI